ncbi:hypothetical protein QE422_001888 [Chryseobacterium sp. SORGH_AS 447]|uniref:hypothetical protein n=1 Tax=Chryseobacterium sp. SORGH_AS_0447 TaxID=3041769 RepID=UPI00278A3563|nr:hypothetical protein [Chryseobacterium sp. SORGH_AS_0447]MDQ1161520.1 hypothetical protein [Chryseobacterium sp. SORGH_AS_0447]
MKSIFITIFAILNLTMYGQKKSVSKSTQIQAGKMISTGDKEIDNLIVKLKKSMENYMKEANPSYSQKDVNECVSLLSNFVINIFKTHSKDEALLIVKSTVLKLNALNERCDHSLIETNEREQIAEIIILASHKMKYNSLNEDITEKWREW